MVPFCSQIQPIYRRRRTEIYPCPSVEIFVPTCRGRRPDVPSARQRRAARLPPCGTVDAARRWRFSSQRWRSRAAILCVWQADPTQLGGNIPVPVGGDFRPSDGEAVPPYFVYGKRIRRSWGGNIPVPVGGDFRPGDGEAVPPYFVYGKRIRRSWGGNNPDGGYIHMAKSLNTVPITLLHTGRCAMRSGVISAERDMVLSMSSSSASMAGTP